MNLKCTQSLHKLTGLNSVKLISMVTRCETSLNANNKQALNLSGNVIINNGMGM